MQLSHQQQAPSHRDSDGDHQGSPSSRNGAVLVGYGRDDSSFCNTSECAVPLHRCRKVIGISVG